MVYKRGIYAPFGGKTHTYLNANGNGNDEHSFSNVAHVFGIGAKYQLGANASVTVDMAKTAPTWAVI